MTSKALRQVLVGLGSGVDVDTALRATCTLKVAPVKVHPDEDIGSYAPARHYVAQVVLDGALKMDATYEQIIIPLSMAMGEVALPPAWEWALPDTEATDFALWTLEYTDGGVHVVRAEDVFAKSLTISGEAGKGWVVDAELAGGAVTLPGTLSATPGIDPVTPILMAHTALYIDDTYAAMGGNPVDELISFNWKLEELQHSKQWAGSLYPNSRGNAKWKTTLELILEAEADEAADLAAALLTIGQFAIRVQADDAASIVTIDGMYMVESVDTLDDRDGNNTLKITCLGEKDADGNTGAVTVINTVIEL